MESSYRRIFAPDHPKADVTGFISEHILIAEKRLGRPLQKDEVVHHIDFNKLNNSPENLLVMTRRQHQQIPLRQIEFLVSRNLVPEFLAYWETVKDGSPREQQLEAAYTLQRQINKLSRQMSKHSPEQLEGAPA